MDELIKQLIVGAPNLAVSLAAMWWLSRKMDRILDVLLEMLIDRVQEKQLAEGKPVFSRSLDRKDPSTKEYNDR